jgi:hypothetical protein
MSLKAFLKGAEKMKWYRNPMPKKLQIETKFLKFEEVYQANLAVDLK